MYKKKSLLMNTKRKEKQKQEEMTNNAPKSKLIATNPKLQRAKPPAMVAAEPPA